VPETLDDCHAVVQYGLGPDVYDVIFRHSCHIDLEHIFCLKLRFLYASTGKVNGTCFLKVFTDHGFNHLFKVCVIMGYLCQDYHIVFDGVIAKIYFDQDYEDR